MVILLPQPTKHGDYRLHHHALDLVLCNCALFTLALEFELSVTENDLELLILPKLELAALILQCSALADQTHRQRSPPVLM